MHFTVLSCHLIPDARVAPSCGLASCSFRSDRLKVALSEHGQLALFSSLQLQRLPAIDSTGALVNGGWFAMKHQLVVGEAGAGSPSVVELSRWLFTECDCFLS